VCTHGTPRQRTIHGIISGERMSHPYVVCDVFTDKALEGNQLGVFTDARAIPDEQMQRLAREMNFSETTFVLPAEEDGTARIRIFTPATELPFAGHPTLGTAVVLAEARGLDLVRLETQSGIVPVTIDRRNGAPTFGRMEQPLPSVAPYELADELLAALRVNRSELPVEVYDNGVRHAYVMLASPEAVASLRPETGALEQLGNVGANAFAGFGTRYKTRMFGTGMGVTEDPATGSAAGPLALHLVRHGRVPWGTEIEISQGVEIGRPSRLFARAVGSPDRLERVEVGGSAVIVARGEFLL